MKSIFTILGLCLFALPAFSQSIDGTLMHDGIERSYIIYLPGNYTGDEAVPLVFNFHGYTSNAGEQQVYGDFRALSEENGFIIVHPQGTEFQGSTHWNVGDWTGGSTVDDIGFTDALLDDLIANYNIDEDRVQQLIAMLPTLRQSWKSMGRLIQRCLTMVMLLWIQSKI